MNILLPPLLRNTLLALISCSGLVVICYWFVDQPVVFWAAKYNFQSYELLYYLAHIPNMLASTIMVVYLYLAIVFCYRSLYLQERILCAAANSIVIGEFIKSTLKIVFGRYWPATWTQHNLSLLHDNVYGFYWFHGGAANQSFPSGHATMTLAAMTVLWLFYPRLRWVAVLITVSVLLSQALMYYHFVGDLIAGAFLGSLVAIYTVRISALSVNSLHKTSLFKKT